MNPHKTPHKDHEDDLPELPPLDDDGSLFEGDDTPLLVEHDEGGLDDRTSEYDLDDRFGAFGISTDDEAGSLLDGAEGNDQMVVTDDRDLLAGAEIGLLEDSDEGDGREISADEAGVFADDARFEDDGGAEGTGEDPSAALEAMPGELHVGDASDDEGIEDDARFEDAATARARQHLEREPWPRRSDASWIISRCEDDVSGATSLTADGDLVAATRDGALIVSTDGGASFTRVSGCANVTAIALLSSERQRVVLAALHDPTRDAAAVVLVRLNGHPTAELIADLMADETDEDVRITSLHVRARREGAHEHVEVIVRGPFGAVQLRPRAR